MKIATLLFIGTVDDATRVEGGKYTPNTQRQTCTHAHTDTHALETQYI